MLNARIAPVSSLAPWTILRAGVARTASARRIEAKQSRDFGHAMRPVPGIAIAAATQEDIASIHVALDELRHYELGHMPRPLAFEQIDAIVGAIEELSVRNKNGTEKGTALQSMLSRLLDDVRAFRRDPMNTAHIAAMRDTLSANPLPSQ